MTTFFSDRLEKMVIFDFLFQYSILIQKIKSGSMTLADTYNETLLGGPLSDISRSRSKRVKILKEAETAV